MSPSSEGFFISATSFCCLGSVAQLVERTTENREVTGSTPVGATHKAPELQGLFYIPHADTDQV
jgi:hypothetical protein